MAVKKLEAAARRLVKKLAELALGPMSPEPEPERARGATAAKIEGDHVSADELKTAAAADAGVAEASPIRTRTLARLLAEQGHTADALAIYEELITANVDDLSLVREAGALRSRRVVHPVTPAIAAVRAPAALYGRDQITASVVDPGTLFVHWEVTDDGAARARIVAESAGRSAGEPAPATESPLTLRIVMLRPDGAGVVRSEVIEHAPAPSGGETFVEGLPPEATLFAAIGVRRGERFVAVTHAQAAHTPPNAPAPLPALAFAPPPPAPESPLDESPPVAPVAVMLPPPAAAVVIDKAEALRAPTASAHFSDADFHAPSSH